MKTSHFADVTPEVWIDFKANIQKDDGAVMTGDEGVAELKGLKYTYKYDASAHSLVVTELD